jgi:hypothetical protein
VLIVGYKYTKSKAEGFLSEFGDFPIFLGFFNFLRVRALLCSELLLLLLLLLCLRERERERVFCRQ